MIMYFASFFIQQGPATFTFGNTSFMSDKRITSAADILKLEAEMLKAMQHKRPESRYDDLKIISFQILDEDPPDDDADDEAMHVKTWGLP